MKKRKMSQRSLNLIVISVFLIIINVSLGFFLFLQSKNAIVEQIRGRMLDIAKTAADSLNGDELKQLKKEDKNTAPYQKVIRTLTCFQDNIDLSYIYCIQDLGNKHFAFSVDPTVRDPGEFGEPIQYTDALYAASLGTPAVDLKPYQDRWGRFYSAYSPVFDSIGKVAGIVAVDFSADWYEHEISELIRTVLLFCILSVLAGGLIVFVLTENTRKRYRMVYSQLNELADNVEDLIREIEQSPNEAEKHAPAGKVSGEADDLGEKIQSLQKTLRSEIAHVHLLAYIDALTSVGNKTAYLDMIEHLDREIEAGTADFTVATFDMNGLKIINDTYGHEVGDQALIKIADILIGVFGKEHIFRVGGDEFIVIMCSCPGEKTEALFRRVNDALAEENRRESTDRFMLSVSKGYALFAADKDREFRSVFKRADDAMYRDKEAYYAKNAERRRAVYHTNT
ncbi:diguanylate cyclase [Ruminococcus sp.]|uniref:sensor domain-containing diguanylate cyclase n=1 Tax=Ruminococcus sp. TaxID=41978 RepID=UPI00388E64D4